MPRPDDELPAAGTLLRFAPRAVAAVAAALYAGDVVPIELGAAVFIAALLADLWVGSRRR